MKYKCKEENCGHIFEGDDYSTPLCPKCKSDNVEPIGGGFPWKKVLMGIGIVVALLLSYLIIKKIGDGSKQSFLYSITVTQDSVNVFVEVSAIGGDSLDIRLLRDSCHVMVLDSSDIQMCQPSRFSLKSNKLSYAVSMFEPGCVYRVVLCKKNGGVEISSATFEIPMPPSPPFISIEPPVPETDPKDECRLLGTYKVVINVTEGKADIFSIDGVEYNTNVINGIQPRPRNSQYVIVRAYNSEDRLWSDSISYRLPPINRSSVYAPDQAEIQAIFDRVANRKMYAGDALKLISNERSIPVKVNGSNSDLENVLQVSYQQRKKMVVKKVNYSGNKCSRTIVSIEI